MERGASVAYFGGDPDRVIVLKSADWWGPVLRVTEEIITGVAGAALYDAIKTLVGRRRGHWRTLGSGTARERIVWVRSTTVGEPGDGGPRF